MSSVLGNEAGYLASTQQPGSFIIFMCKVIHSCNVAVVCTVSIIMLSAYQRWLEVEAPPCRDTLAGIIQDMPPPEHIAGLAAGSVGMLE